MKLTFITQNKKKVEQLKAFFVPYNISIEQYDFDYEEPEGLTIQETAIQGAKECSQKLKTALIVEDSGIFFEDYDQFPGVRSKKTFQQLGYEGLLRKIKQAKTKKAYFLSTIAYVEPENDPILFEGKIKGKLIPELRAPQGYDPNNYYPYDRFFIPPGSNQTLAELRVKGISQSDHRTKACMKLLEYLKDK